MSKNIKWILCLMMVMSLPVYASDTGTIYVDYHGEGVILPYVDFNLYYLYTVDRYGDFVPTDDFEDLGDIQDLTDNEAWSIQSQTAFNFISIHSVKADFQDSTDDMGRAVIEDLEEGVYLLCFEKTTVEGMEYESDPILIMVPGTVDGDDEWTQSIIPKVEGYEVEEDFLIQVILLKRWRNDSGLDVRPDDVTFYLYENGKIYDTVTLTEEYAWAYRWENLDGASTWAITEGELPDGYECVYQGMEGDRYTKIFTFHNIYTGESQLGGGDSVGVGGGSAVAGEGYETDVEGALTQTGALIWPIPVLGFTGMILIAFGLMLRKDRDEKSEC